MDKNPRIIRQEFKIQLKLIFQHEMRLSTLPSTRRFFYSNTVTMSQLFLPTFLGSRNFFKNFIKSCAKEAACYFDNICLLFNNCLENFRSHWTREFYRQKFKVFYWIKVTGKSPLETRRYVAGVLHKEMKMINCVVKNA